MKPETLAIHAGNLKRSATGDVTSPISLSTTFFRDQDGYYPGGHMYSRVTNPNRSALEKVLYELEGGTACAAFASGNAAGMSLFQALPAGSHIIAPDDMYWGLKKQLLTIFKDILTYSFIDLSNVQDVRAAINDKTTMIWAETPSNPLLKICDLKALSAICREHELIFAVDNTFASPALQNPIALGADIVMHSSTKYIGGHSDVLGGALITAKQDALWERVINVQQTGGAVPSPFDCFLLLRSLKTLHYRMKGHCVNATKIAMFCKEHQGVEGVYFPGLPDHPGHDIAISQMRDFGGMLSILVKGGEVGAATVVNNLKLFAQATSLGGVESLIEHRYSVEGPDSKTPKNLLRISVGLENAEDLIEDLRQALAKV